MTEEFDTVIDDEAELSAGDARPDADAQEAPSSDAVDSLAPGTQEAAAPDLEEGVADEASDTPQIETSFGTVTGRLDEIAGTLEDETLPLEDALDLLEEAVALGMQASNLLEDDMAARNAADEPEDEPSDRLNEIAEGMREEEG